MRLKMAEEDFEFFSRSHYIRFGFGIRKWM
jgi:hypothetical protein